MANVHIKALKTPSIILSVRGKIDRKRGLITSDNGKLTGSFVSEVETSYAAFAISKNKNLIKETAALVGEAETILLDFPEAQPGLVKTPVLNSSDAKNNRAVVTSLASRRKSFKRLIEIKEILLSDSRVLHDTLYETAERLKSKMAVYDSSYSYPEYKAQADEVLEQHHKSHEEVLNRIERLTKEA